MNPDKAETNTNGLRFSLRGSGRRTIFAPVSAKSVDWYWMDSFEMILLVAGSARVQKQTQNKRARGIVIEAELIKVADQSQRFWCKMVR